MQHSPAARAENSLLYTRIETFSYTTCVKKAISAQRPNGKDTLSLKKLNLILIFQWFPLILVHVPEVMVFKEIIEGATDKRSPP